jgi:putative ABC transport system substrate-binding protein
LAIEYRWADGQYDRLPALALELVQRPVNLIVAVGGATPVRAAKAATSTIPLVFVMGDLDPVKSGVVASMNRPGGNITGVTPFLFALGAKRLELLGKMVPKVTAIDMIVNQTNPYSELETREVEDAARALGLQLRVVNASNNSEIDAAFAALVRLSARA